MQQLQQHDSAAAPTQNTIILINGKTAVRLKLYPITNKLNLKVMSTTTKNTANKQTSANKVNEQANKKFAKQVEKQAKKAERTEIERIFALANKEGKSPRAIARNCMAVAENEESMQMYLRVLCEASDYSEVSTNKIVQAISKYYTYKDVDDKTLLSRKKVYCESNKDVCYIFAVKENFTAKDVKTCYINIVERKKQQTYNSAKVYNASMEIVKGAKLQKVLDEHEEICKQRAEQAKQDRLAGMALRLKECGVM